MTEMDFVCSLNFFLSEKEIYFLVTLVVGVVDCGKPVPGAEPRRFFLNTASPRFSTALHSVGAVFLFHNRFSAFPQPNVEIRPLSWS